MLPKTYDRWSDEAREERMRQNRILWDPSVISNQADRVGNRVGQIAPRSRSETRNCQTNQQVARSSSETRQISQISIPGQERTSQLRDHQLARSLSESRSSNRMEVMLQEGQECRSKSEERVSSSKTQKEPTTQDGSRTTTRKGREEERRMPLPKVRKSVRISKKESEQEPKQRAGENLCGKCSKKVANGVHCTVCDTWYHFMCENTSQEEINEKYAREEDDYACLKHRVPQSNVIKGETDVHFKVWDQKPITGAENEKGGDIKEIVNEKCNQREKDQSPQPTKEGSTHHNSGDREVDKEPNESLNIQEEADREKKESTSLGEKDTVVNSTNENEIANEAEAKRPAAAQGSAKESTSDLLNTVIETDMTEVKTTNSEVTYESSQFIPEVFKEWDTLEAKLEKSEIDLAMHSVALSDDSKISTNGDKATNERENDDESSNSTNKKENDEVSKRSISTLTKPKEKEGELKLIVTSDSVEKSNKKENHEGSVNLQDLFIKILTKSREQDVRINLLEAERTKYVKEKLIYDTRIKYLEGKIQLLSQTKFICQECPKNKKKLLQQEDTISKMSINAQQGEAIKSSLQKEIKAYETLQSKHLKQIDDMKSEIAEKDIKISEIMEVNKILEEKLQDTHDHSNTADQDIAGEEILEERLQHSHDHSNTASQNIAKEKDESLLVTKSQSLCNAADKPEKAINKDRNNVTRKKTTSEWLNFEEALHERAVVIDQHDKSKGTSNSTEDKNRDSEQRFAPECFGCREKGHVIRDCSKSLNLKITLRDDKEEFNKPKIRSNFSKYGNISSIKMNNDGSAFVCFARKEEGMKLLQNWQRDQTMSEAWELQQYRKREIKCFNCGRYGHIAKTCEQPAGQRRITNTSQSERKRLQQEKSQAPTDFFALTSNDIEKSNQQSQYGGCEYPQQIRDLQNQMKEVQDLLQLMYNNQRQQSEQ